MHETPPQKARHTQHKMRLHFANIASHGKSVIDWLWGRDSEPDAQKHSSLCQYCAVRGKHTLGNIAATNRTNDGTHGGILILADRSRHH